MPIQVLGDSFYRLHVAGFEVGSYVEEREDLPQVLAILEAWKIQLRTVTDTTPARMRFEGEDEQGRPVHVSITFYRASEQSRSWPNPEDLLGKKRWTDGS